MQLTIYHLAISANYTTFCTNRKDLLAVFRQDAELSVRRQCELIGLSRSTLYYEPAMESALNLQLMRLIDAQYTR